MRMTSRAVCVSSLHIHGLPNGVSPAPTPPPGRSTGPKRSTHDGYEWFYYFCPQGATPPWAAHTGGWSPGLRRAGPRWEPELGWGGRYDPAGLRGGPASPVPLADALQLLVDGAEAGPLPGLIGPALLHESEHSIGAQLRAGQAAPCEDRQGTLA